MQYSRIEDKYKVNMEYVRHSFKKICDKEYNITGIFVNTLQSKAFLPGSISLEN